MQTFLPYPSFADSAACLDRARLGRQRVEAWQILGILSKASVEPVYGHSAATKPVPWSHHPVVLQWVGSEYWLAQYGRTICEEWVKRGYKDTMLDCFIKILPDLDQSNLPPWLFSKSYHLSHQSNLVRKDIDFYGPKFPGVSPLLPYIWPVTIASLRQAEKKTSTKAAGISLALSKGY